MREILFKAKRESNRKWVEGYYYKENFLTGKSVQHFIRGKDDTDYVVCGETVSQYTGFQDRSDNPIFENDILSVETTSDNGVEKREYIVYFGKSGQWYTVSNDADRDNVLLSTLLHKRAIFLKVTGNTFDEAEKMAHEWLMKAIEAVKAGETERLEKDGVIVYKPKADVSVRIDIKNK